MPQPPTGSQGLRNKRGLFSRVLRPFSGDTNVNERRCSVTVRGAPDWQERSEWLL